MNSIINYFTSWKIIFVGGIGLVVIVCVGFKYFNHKKIKENSSSISINKNSQLTASTAIKLSVKINNRLEEIFSEDKKELQAIRKKYFNDMEMYKKICKETYEKKNEAKEMAKTEITEKYGISYEEIRESLCEVEPIYLEKVLSKHYKVKNTDTNYCKKENIYNAYNFYLDRTIEEHKRLYIKYNNSNNDEESNKVKEEEIEVVKLKIYDEIFEKYKLEDIQLDYFFYKYDLDENHEMKRKLNEILSYEN